jgi:uncharacterized protein YceK
MVESDWAKKKAFSCVVSTRALTHLYMRDRRMTKVFAVAHGSHGWRWKSRPVNLAAVRDCSLFRSTQHWSNGRMNQLIIAIMLAATCCLQPGCTSIAVRNQFENTGRNRVIYPGVRQDANFVTMPFVVTGSIFYGLYAIMFAPEKDDAQLGFGLVALPFSIPVACYGLVDTPFSAIADTVMLHSDLKAVTKEKKTEPQPTPATGKGQTR